MPASQPSPRPPSARPGAVMKDRTVVEVLRVEEPAPGEGRRHVVVCWSDGSAGRALSYFADEILVSEGDVVGKTADELLALHFARDRDYRQHSDSAQGRWSCAADRCSRSRMTLYALSAATGARRRRARRSGARLDRVIARDLQQPVAAGQPGDQGARLVVGHRASVRSAARTGPRHVRR